MSTLNFFSGRLKTTPGFLAAGKPEGSKQLGVEISTKHDINWYLDALGGSIAKA